MITERQFREREHAEGLSAAEFRHIQTEWLDMTNEQLGEALGYSDRDKGRKRVSDLRNGRGTVPATVTTILWFLMFNDGEMPAWID